MNLLSLCVKKLNRSKNKSESSELPKKSLSLNRFCLFYFTTHHKIKKSSWSKDSESAPTMNKPNRRNKQNLTKTYKKRSENDSEAAIKLFIGGLPKDSSEAEIYEILQRYAAIYNIELKRRKNKGNQKCLGHGILTTDLQGSKTLVERKYFIYKERTIVVSPYFTGEDLKAYQETFSLRRLFVRGVPYNYKDWDLRRTFTEYGALETCYFRQEPETTERIAVVIYKQAAAAERALENLELLHKQLRTSMTAAYSLTVGEHKKGPKRTNNLL